MLGLPYSTYDMNAYLMGGDYLGSCGNINQSATGISNLGIPKIQSLHIDSFSSHAKQKDKRNINLAYVGLWIAGITATILGGFKCLSKIAELGKDTATSTISNFKYDTKSAKNKLIDLGGAIVKRLNPKNWFKK